MYCYLGLDVAGVAVDVAGAEFDGAAVGEGDAIHVVDNEGDAADGPAVDRACLVEDAPGEAGGLGEVLLHVVHAVVPVEALAAGVVDALFVTSNVTAPAVAARARNREATAATGSFIL